MSKHGLSQARSVARSALRGLKSGVEGYQRCRLAVPQRDPSKLGAPSVYFLTPDYDRPAGGVRVIYRHVDILNTAGIRAAVVHQRAGFRCSWFRNQTPVVDVGRCTLGKNDLLVLSEVDGDLFARLPSGARHVIFNQNAHLTWTRGEEAMTSHLVGNPDLAGIVTVSAHNAAMLGFAFPWLEVRRLHLSLDRELFYDDNSVRARTITYMPRRGSDDARQVLEMCRNRGALDGWAVVPLDGLSHEEVAAQLRLSRIFLAFTYQEGFGLPAAEAMASGNYVIGYHGYGGREFFQPRFSTPISNGDVLDFAERLEALLKLDDVGFEPYRLKASKAAQFIRTTYSAEREAEDVLRIYRGFLPDDERCLENAQRVGR